MERYYAQRELDKKIYDQQRALLVGRMKSAAPGERGKIFEEMNALQLAYDSGEIEEIQLKASQLQQHMSNWQPVLSATQSAYAELMTLDDMRNQALINGMQKAMDQQELMYNNMLIVARAAGEDTVGLEQQKANALLVMENDLTAKKDAIARQSFERNKAMQIAQAIMSTASAVINTLASASLLGGPIWAGIMAGSMATMGAIQVAAISQQQYPGLANGGTLTSSGATWVGENGPELLTLPKASTVKPLDSVGGGSTINISGNTFVGVGGVDSLVKMINTRTKQLQRTGEIV